MRLLIALLAWIGAVVGAAALSSAVASSIHHNPAVASASSSGSGGVSAGSGSGGAPAGSSSGSGAAPVDPSSVKATDPVSLFRSANFARALGAARTQLGAGARLDMLVLYPGYLDITAVRAGTEVNVYLAANSRYTQNNTGGNPGSSPLFSFTQVQSDTPAALAQRIATAGHVPKSQLNYMVVQVNPADHHLRWLVYPRHGNRVEYFQGSGATGPLFEYRSGSSTGLQPVR
jgi:hypothetical protein